MTSFRKQAAIMFSDIAGFTDIMGRDEDKALDMIGIYESNIHNLVAARNGSVVNFYGDGSLSIFDSPDDAVICAIEVQTDFLNIHKIPLRIGLHFGNVVIKDGNAYGDSVNLASRIESIGQPGAVLCSEEILEQLNNSKLFDPQSLGSWEFKNVPRPMNIYALAARGLKIPQRDSITGKLKTYLDDEKSIAVLPFNEMGGEGGRQFFAEGIADEIRSQLLSVGDLKVISRSSCMHYKGDNVELRKVGAELQVSHVLEGRVQIYNDQFRVSCDLSDTRTNRTIWSLPPEISKSDNIFQVLNDVAQNVVNELRLILSQTEENRLNRIPTKSQDAYRIYQEGMDMVHRGHGNVEELNNALEKFNKAIELDPQFSRAYLGIAECYLEHIFWGRAAPADIIPKAYEATNKALEIDDMSGEAYGVLGSIMAFEFKFTEGKKYLERSIELSPNYINSYNRLAYLHIAEMDLDNALKMLGKAHDLDPLSTKIYGEMGQAYYNLGKYDEGLEFLEGIQKKYPKDAWIQWVRGYLYTGKGEFDKAAELLASRGTYGKNTNWLLGFNYGKLGKTKEAEAILTFHLQKKTLDYVPSFMIAAICAGLGKIEEAVDWMELDLKEGGAAFYFMSQLDEPIFHDIKANERYRSLNLPKYI